MNTIDEDCLSVIIKHLDVPSVVNLTMVCKNLN